MKVLIVGAGIAGPTLAYWLQRSGHQPTVLERASRRREGGYVIDFWGTGFDVAERMGLIPKIMAKGYRVTQMREVSRSGRLISRLDPRSVIDGTRGRYVTIARSDLAEIICDALDEKTEQIFGDEVQELDDDGTRVRVTFASGTSRDFDLVIGADGLHSSIRRLVFGADDEFERNLGISVAAFDLTDYEPREDLIAVTHTEVGAQALRFTLRDGSTMFCFTFRQDPDVPLDDIEAQKELVKERLSGMGWEVPRILAGIDDARTFYFDRASQILLPTWSRGRVALIGDAAACPSLLAGQGSALAMVEAYVLAAELAAAGEDYSAAFAAYEARLSTAVRTKQDAAIGLGGAFSPRNRLQLWVRNLVIGLMGIPFVAQLAVGRSLRDPIKLPAPQPD